MKLIRLSVPWLVFLLLLLCLPTNATAQAQVNTVNLAPWEIGPFVKCDDANPILSPIPDGTFVDPMSGKSVAWEKDNVFNPGAVARGKNVYLIYRAEDDSGKGIGGHTSRLGIAVSRDGIHFKTFPSPVLFPDVDNQKAFDWPGGDEDPRIVDTGQHSYVMTYTSWNRNVARLSIATSSDLFHWTKCGPAFAKAFDGRFVDMHSKSGSIVTTLDKGHLIATKVDGKFWMYYGDGTISAATSDDLINWTPVLGPDGGLLPVLMPRPGDFDSRLAEAGPPGVLTKKGIVLLYNGMGDGGAYSGGEALLDPTDPTKVIARPETCFIAPERPYETNGQYAAGTVFVEGLVYFKKRWFLYYGAADSHVAAATTK